MSMDWPTLIAIPLVAAAIGYFTNWVAIWMLFRPHAEKRIFGLRVPFTPGLIPARRLEMAERLGRAIAKHLITEEAISARLDTPEIHAKIEEIVSSYLDEWLTKELGPLETLIPSELKEMVYQRMGELMPIMLDELALVLEDERLKKLLKIEIYEYMDQLITDTFKADSLWDQLKFRLMETFVISTDEIKQKIDRTVEEAAPRLATLLGRDEIRERIYRSLAGAVAGFLAKPMGRLRDHIPEEHLQQGRVWITRQVLEILKRETPKIVQAIDVERLVREKVNEMPIAEVERLILAITSRQLIAITWFGALLGLLIGLVQVVLMRL